MARNSTERRTTRAGIISIGRDTGRLLITSSKYLIVSILLCCSLPSFSQVEGNLLTDRTRILFILDASNSMLNEMSSGESKMDVAKEVLSDLVDSLRNYPKLEVALRVYGHNYKPNIDACVDTNLEVPFSEDNHSEIISRLDEIKPKGGTPIAYSLEQTVKDFPTDQKSYNVVILITDGAESCKGDPCEVSKKLQKNGVFLQPYIISLDMKAEYRQLFDCIGMQYSVNDIPTFKGALDESVRMTLEGPTVSIQILNSKGKPYRSDLAVTLYNKKTNEPKYQLIHYSDQMGNSDTLLLPPAIDYDIEVSTIPPVIQRNIRFVEGTHTLHKIPAPQGNLDLFMKNDIYYKKPVMGLLRKKGSSEIIHTQFTNSRQTYLAGSYELEVMTRPPVLFTNLNIQGETTSIIRVPEPGYVSINHMVKGLLTIYKIDGLKPLQFVEKRLLESKQELITMQPGNYQLAFRALNAKGSKFTVVKEFEIKSRTTTKVSIYK